MLILTIRTDKPEAELGLYDDAKQLGYVKWQAHRELSETIHVKIKQLLKKNKVNLSDLNAIAVFKGPGSFTGLRIGLSVANSLAYALNIPIVSTQGEQWIEDGVKRLKGSEDETVALPEYGSPPHITKPRK